MKPARVAAILMLAFLFGGSSAEVAVQATRAIGRHRAEPGSSGDLLALEIRGADGAVLARPRLVCAPGRAAQLALRDPLHPDVVRLALRVETWRDPSGDVSVDYDLAVPGALAAVGRVQAEPGVEQRLDVGDAPITVTLLALPVPSAAFDAFLDAERARRAVANPT